MNSKILNIVKFTITDQVGNTKTNWNEAAVFYDGGYVEFVTLEDAVNLAATEHVIVSEATPEELTDHFEDFRNIAGYDIRKKKKDKKVDSVTQQTTDSNEKKVQEKTNTKTEVHKPKPIKLKKEKTNIKKEKGFFGRAASAVAGVLGGLAIGVNKKIDNLANWLTVHVVRKFDAFGRGKKKKLKDKAAEAVQKQKESAKDYVKASVLERENKKKAKKTKQRVGFGKKIAAFATAAALALGLTSCTASNVNQEQQTETTTLTQDELQSLSAEELLEKIVSGELSLAQVKEMLKDGKITNEALNNLTYAQLLQVTNSAVQQQEMTKVGQYLDYFNGVFADKYLEQNHSAIRAALTWEEVNAINLAYNDFSKEEIRAIFNGEEVSSADFTNSYKEATLQLMGAFVLETRDTPVNLDSLLNTDEGKAFYQKYNELFLKCKETTGEEQVNAVNAFYQELFKDYPISSDVREVGISHSESRDDIESYKLSITPMVAAAEMMFQNLSIDHTLSDKAIAYFNDLGLCEYAQGKYERAEQITLCSADDNSLPTYQQFMSAKVKELTDKNIYFVSDEKRDLSQYDLFQKWVNGHFNFDENGKFVIDGSISQSITSSVVGTYSKSSTTYRTETITTTTSDRNKAVSMAGEDAVRKAEEAVNQKFAEENAESKKQGEAQAEANKQQMQEEADKKSEEIQEEIKKDDQDLQDKIDDANDKLNQGGTVNESELDHGVEFDDNHSNENGDLDDSIKDMTTDGTGSGGSLPDPEESGNQFDQNQPDYNNQPEGTINPGQVDDQTFIEYEEEVIQPTSTLTNEEIAEAIVNDMALNPTVTDEEYVYTK